MILLLLTQLCPPNEAKIYLFFEKGRVAIIACTKSWKFWASTWTIHYKINWELLIPWLQFPISNNQYYDHHRKKYGLV